jgi:hypothetical protein
MTFLHLFRVDRLFGQAEEFAVLAERRRPSLSGALVRRYPVTAAAIMDAGDAAGACLVPGHPPVDACGSHRFDPDALHHQGHGFCLLQHPLHHRPAVAEIAHGNASRPCHTEGPIRAVIDLDQECCGELAAQPGLERADRMPRTPIKMRGVVPAVGRRRWQTRKGNNPGSRGKMQHGFSRNAESGSDPGKRRKNDGVVDGLHCPVRGERFAGVTQAGPCHDRQRHRTDRPRGPGVQRPRR